MEGRTSSFEIKERKVEVGNGLLISGKRGRKFTRQALDKKVEGKRGRGEMKEGSDNKYWLLHVNKLKALNEL